MNGFSYAGGYEANGMDQNGQYGQGDSMMMGADGMGGQSLDEIVNHNAKVMRRQSMPQQYGATPQQADADLRRISMMDYHASSAGQLNNFGFDLSASMDQGGMMASAGASGLPNQVRTTRDSRESSGDLALNTTFGNTPQSYNAVMPSHSAFTSPSHASAGFDIAMNSPYVGSNLGMSMEYSMGHGMGGGITGTSLNVNPYNQTQFNAQMVNSPANAASSNAPQTSTPRNPISDPNGGGSSDMSSQYSGPGGNSGASTVRALSRTQSINQMSSASPAQSNMTPVHPSGLTHSVEKSNTGGFPQQSQLPEPSPRQGGAVQTQRFNGINGPLPVNLANYNPNNQGFQWDAPDGGWPSSMIGRTHAQTSYKNAYSSTGFDMLGVLMRVATRPNPEINIGAVDLSCAFVVCDAEKDDVPIVYCSENFERLTGYTKHMTLGRNCRFLQSPDGNVESGVPRKYVDDNSVLYLKNMITLRREAQISLINYRRGGQPFMNLLTMIPITWDTDQVKFFVGFQVDLVEQPNAVTNKNPDGSYSVSYQRGMTMPRYVMNAPDSGPKTDLGQTIPRDDVSAILSSFGTGESEYAKRIWDKVLLENTDDVVHVLSLKGLFQWISPSAARVLEYEPSEIIGTALSSVCHPSDIVPVTRELKDTSSGASVNVVFRIRRKLSGYMWFEGHGSLHTEQGKGRKSIIMVGRERPVYALSKSEIIKAGGIGENELWTKMSTSGMFLFVSSNVRQLLDRQPDDLVGISIQSLMRAESKPEFGRILELARTGKKASVKHELINRRGQVLSAFTTLYPGDATEGLKPTFIVAQTRLVKFSRGAQSIRPSVYPKPERNLSESTQSSAGASQQFSMGMSHQGGGDSPASANSSAHFIGTEGAAATYGGQNSLRIGHQDVSLASEDNLFDELKTTKSSSWQYEIRQLEKRNRMLAEELQSLIAAKKKRKRRKNGGNMTKDCANCHTVTPEWRRGPSGQRDLCNSCGLRWAKLNGRVSPRNSSKHSVHSGGASDKGSKASTPPYNSGLATGQQNVSKAESPSQRPRLLNSQQAASKAAIAGVDPTDSPSKASKPPEGHAASMEGASGVPDRIEEAIEPD